MSELLEDINFMKRLLPDHYSVFDLPKGGIRCHSRKGIDEKDPEQWFYTFAAIKQHFGDRFLELYHNTNYNHVDFVVYLKKP